MSVSDDAELLTGKVQWSPSIEHMLTRWCDQAKAFEWMHTEAFSFNDTRARTAAIVSNVFTAVAGLSNVAIGGTAINGFQLAWVFGAMSILVSITNMIQEKMAYASSAADHRQYAISWGTIRRKIEEELGVPPAARKDCKTFMKYIRQDINQASTDGNTMIPEFIRDSCFNKFSAIPDFVLPDICGDLSHTQTYKGAAAAGGLHSPLLINIPTPPPPAAL
jgi:hypothetical protein